MFLFFFSLSSLSFFLSLNIPLSPPPLLPFSPSQTLPLPIFELLPRSIFVYILQTSFSIRMLSPSLDTSSFLICPLSSFPFLPPSPLPRCFSPSSLLSPLNSFSLSIHPLSSPSPSPSLLLPLLLSQSLVLLSSFLSSP